MPTRCRLSAILSLPLAVLLAAGALAGLLRRVRPAGVATTAASD